MRYVLSRANIEREERTYRIYTTDALQIIAENTGKAVPKGRYMRERYADIVYADKTVQEDDARSCNEIVAEMWRNLRGEEVTP